MVRIVSGSVGVTDNDIWEKVREQRLHWVRPKAKTITTLVRVLKLWGAGKGGPRIEVQGEVWWKVGVRIKVGKIDF